MTDQEYCADILINKPHIFGHLLGYTKLLPLHSEWIKMIWDADRETSLLAHRGSYKSTSCGIVGAVRQLILRPNRIVFIIRKEHKNQTQKMIKAIRNALEKKEVRDFTEKLTGKPIELTQADNTTLTTNYKTKTTIESQLMGFSVNVGLTSWHCDDLYTDDIETIEDRTSRAERLKTITIYQELTANILNPGGIVRNVGTPWHKEGATSLFNNVHRYTVHESTIPDFTPDHIEKLRGILTPQLFAANYELRHIASEDQLFTEPLRGEWNRKLIASMHIDAKYSGEHTGAVTIMARAGNGIQASGRMFTKNAFDLIDWFKELNEKYGRPMIYVEDNADKGALAKELRQAGCRVSSYHESTNKHVKISDYLYPTWKQIYWDYDTDPGYINQILDYAEGLEPDDCADSASSLIRQAGLRESARQILAMY